MFFYERFEALCKEKGTKPTPASVAAGCSRGVASHWKRKYLNGENALPDSDSAVKLAAYFGVSVDYLLGKEDEKKEASNGASDIDSLILDYASKMTPESRQALIKYMEFLVANQNKEDGND